MIHLVSFHDTDIFKQVYQSRPLEWIDPLRMELLENYYKPINELIDNNEYFYIRGAAVDFIHPMRIGDRIRIETDTIDIKSASFRMNHRYYRNDILAATSFVKLVYCINGKAKRMPSGLVEAIENFGKG